jgi:hypothetical protein
VLVVGIALFQRLGNDDLWAASHRADQVIVIRRRKIFSVSAELSGRGTYLHGSRCGCP